MSSKAALKQFVACSLFLGLALGSPAWAATIVSGFPSGPGGLWSGGAEGSFSSANGTTATWNGTFGAAIYQWTGGITPGTEYQINFTTNINLAGNWGPMGFAIQGSQIAYLNHASPKAIIDGNGLYNNTDQWQQLGTFTNTSNMFNYATVGGVPWTVKINGAGQGVMTTSIASGSWTFSVPQSQTLYVGLGNAYRNQSAFSSATDFSITSIDPIFSTTYTLAATTGASAIRVGGTASITATVTNTGTVAGSTAADSLAVSGLGVGVSPSGSVTLSPTSGTAANTNGTVVGSGNFTAATGGLYTFTPSVTSATNATIGGAATATGTTTTTVTVWNPAAANSISGTVDFGVVLKNTPLSQELTISNTAPNNGYSEKLGAAFGTPTGLASASGSWDLLAADDTSTAFSISLASGSAGAATGSVPVNFTTDGAGTSGLGSMGIGMQTVNVAATVLDAALASFTSGSTQTSLSIDFGTVNQGDVVSAQAFSLYDLMQTIGYTADLALIEVFPGSGNTGALGTNLATFSSLTAGSSSAWEATVNTANEGTFTNTWTLEFKSANGGTVFLGDPSQFLTLTTNVLVVPEPAALVLVGLGAIAVGAVARRRRRA